MNSSSECPKRLLLSQFFPVQPPNLNYPRRRSRRALSRNADTILLFAEDSLAVREAMVVARFEYGLRLLAIVAARSDILLMVLSVFQSRAFS